MAFKLARKRKSRLTSVEKSNVLEVSMLWKEVVTRVGQAYPDVALSHMCARRCSPACIRPWNVVLAHAAQRAPLRRYVDNAAMQIIRNPRSFDTLVTGNIFGDILSDAASMLTGSLGMLPSASIAESGPGIYEPVCALLLATSNSIQAQSVAGGLAWLPWAEVEALAHRFMGPRPTLLGRTLPTPWPWC